MTNQELLSRFEYYLRRIRCASENTCSSYLRDLYKLDRFSASGNLSFTEFTESELQSFLDALRLEGLSDSSCVRCKASVRCFFSWMEEEGHIERAPSFGNCPQKRPAKKPAEILSSREIDLLLSQPNPRDAKGMRDAAMLELLYTTGIQISEMLELRLQDVIFQAACIHCFNDHRERILPMMPNTLQSLQKYLLFARPQLVRSEEEQSLFLNLSGEKLSRQGFWKMVRFYQVKAGIRREITPCMLRCSFAAQRSERGEDIGSRRKELAHKEAFLTKHSSQAMQSPFRDLLQNPYPHAQ